VILDQDFIKEIFLSEIYKIVIEDDRILRELCGSNDQNLRYLEKAAGVPVYVRGNEIHLRTDEVKRREFFVKLIQELEQRISNGQSPGEELIHNLELTILEGKGGDLNILTRSPIIIPMSGIKVFPRSLNQALFLEAMESNGITFSIGPAGTGKTYLAIARALSDVLSKKYRKLVLTRPVVEAGESLGFLPGDLAQKISPYLRPLYDAMEDLLSPETIQRMEENRVIEIAPLAYMRGRSLKNCIVVLDEAQNTTRAQMKMFLTRLGENSKAIITGDISQIDLPKAQDSGLIQAEGLLRDISGIHFSYLEKQDVVRNPLIKKIIEAYEKT